MGEKLNLVKDLLVIVYDCLSDEFVGKKRGTKKGDSKEVIKETGHDVISYGNLLCNSCYKESSEVKYIREPFTRRNFLNGPLMPFQAIDGSFLDHNRNLTKDKQ